MRIQNLPIYCKMCILFQKSGMFFETNFVQRKLRFKNMARGVMYMGFSFFFFKCCMSADSLQSLSLQINCHNRWCQTHDDNLMMWCTDHRNIDPLLIRNSANDRLFYTQCRLCRQICNLHRL